jgi:hypothetical protein
VQIVSILGTMLLAASNSQGDPLTYYGVVATIIPVLYLGLILQSGVFNDDGVWGAPNSEAREGRALVVAAISTIAVLAEFGALLALATSRPSPVIAFDVGFVTMVMGLMLVFGIVTTAFRELPDPGARRKLNRWAAASVTFLLVLGCIYLWSRLHLSIEDYVSLHDVLP